LRYNADTLRTDWIRPGIALYGSSTDYPQHTITHWGLQPSMTLACKIIAVCALSTGSSVGYGSSFIADKPMRIAVVACGYADGYPRLCPTGTPVLVDGVRTCTVGRVSMDMITIDITHLPHAAMGSEVTLWGRAGNGTVLAIDEVAATAGTVGYELMCALAQRVPVMVEAEA
jgi:alanine racemase